MQDYDYRSQAAKASKRKTTGEEADEALDELIADGDEVAAQKKKKDKQTLGGWGALLSSLGSMELSGDYSEGAGRNIYE